VGEFEVLANEIGTGHWSLSGLCCCSNHCAHHFRRNKIKGSVGKASMQLVARQEKEMSWYRLRRIIHVQHQDLCSIKTCARPLPLIFQATTLSLPMFGQLNEGILEMIWCRELKREEACCQRETKMFNIGNI